MDQSIRPELNQLQIVSDSVEILIEAENVYKEDSPFKHGDISFIFVNDGEVVAQLERRDKDKLLVNNGYSCIQAEFEKGEVVAEEFREVTRR